eukprot:TRINITY_DN9113_c0_g2_i4.p3 TRINITY_DN9113_c0_g2~~TRINITY_DN9113_c0_g2_i4.p3  ORF type:complete len:115 (+),score=3.08 TRINITY_DN9113_c0_g2_i4:152-496(+)
MSRAFKCRKGCLGCIVQVHYVQLKNVTLRIQQRPHIRHSSSQIPVHKLLDISSCTGNYVKQLLVYSYYYKEAFVEGFALHVVDFFFAHFQGASVEDAYWSVLEDFEVLCTCEQF